MKRGIKSLGAYLPYHYLSRATINKAWGGKGGKGEKSVADVDEDSVTMAVEAAMGCFRLIDRNEITALYFASTSAPYAEKSHSALISVACDLPDTSVFATDVMCSTKSGTNAIKLALDAVSAHEGDAVLVTAADMRNGFPKSGQEAGFGDGAAAVVIGSGDELLAEVLHFTSINEEINDYWRNSGDPFTLHAEGRFCDEKGYLREMNLIIPKMLQETESQMSDYAHVVLVAQNAKLQAKICKKYGITSDQLVDTLLATAGDTGAAQSLLGIVNALERGQAGEKILVLDYGNGANGLVLEIAPGISKLADSRQMQRLLEKRVELESYAKFLSWRDIAGAEPGAAFRLPASTSQTWREQNINLRLHGSKCKSCGAALFPIGRVCDQCGAKDNYDEVGLSGHISTLYTYSIDKYAGRSDDPLVIQAVIADENGCNVYTILTNCPESEVAHGMQVEYTFRKMHNLGNFPNYFWKVRPLRRESM